ncbi:serine hydrolase [candidate division KSB1 bacterium]|nr:serine hydrolase [candidate division KSB1 bacterium]
MNKIYPVLILTCLVFLNNTCLLSALDNHNGKQDTLPFRIPDDQIKPLVQLGDLTLQKNLEKEIFNHTIWASLVKKKKMAVGIVDLSDPYHAKFARLNGDKMMYAASLPKLAILLGAAQSLEDGKLEETPEVLNDMRKMISNSDNQAATRMIDRIGLEKIEDTLRDKKYELYDPRRGGGLWVGKRYAKSGNRNGDPLFNISHGATATQVCRFYYLLAMGKLVSWERSHMMLDMLIDPEIHHKFVNSLDNLAPDAKVYRKSGTWQNWHSDSALVWGPKWRRYIVVGLIEDKNGEQILRNLIPAMEKVLLTTKQNN